jgi:hypothetical protein
MFDGVEARAHASRNIILKWRGNDRSRRGDAAVVFCVEAPFPLADWRGTGSRRRRAAGSPIFD